MVKEKSVTRGECRIGNGSKKLNFDMILKNKWKFLSIILAVLLLTSVIVNITATGKIVSKSAISAKEAENLIKEFAQMQGLEVDKYSTEMESGVYAITTTVDGQEYSPIYLTADGKYIVYGSLIPLEELFEDYGETQNVQTEIVKSERPSIDLFIMTHCPYGTQAEKGFLPVARALEDKADINIRFVHYFMHEQEYDETPIEICIREEQRDKFLDYLDCFLEGDGVDVGGYMAEGNDPELCMKRVGVDINAVNSCVESGDWEDYYEEDSILSQLYGVQGSPTLVINGAQASYGRSAASYLNGACSAFLVKPEECSVLNLSGETPGVYFGWTSTAGTTLSGQC